MRTDVACRQRLQKSEVASNSLNESATDDSVCVARRFLKRNSAGHRRILTLPGIEPTVWGLSMRLVRLLIWLATLFFAVMLFLPLVRQIILRLTEPGNVLP